MADSPFKLFEPYSSSDKEIFFGRDVEIYALYNLLQQTRLLLFYGPSGTGKTSIINAGLPKVFKVTDWSRISVRRRDDINESFRSELKRILEQEEEISSLDSAINDIYKNRWIPVYLVFDQFEEIFTLGDHDERVTFFKDIQSLLTLSIPCKIILSMREEYIGHLYEYEQYVPGLFDNRFRVEPMKDDTTCAVIVDMCQAVDIKLENGLDTARYILRQVKEGTQAAHLPYLQIYLHYLFIHECKIQTSSKITFTEAGIEAVGRLGNVLRLFIESMLERAKGEFVILGLPDDFASLLLDEFATDEGTKQSRKILELATKLEVDEVKMRNALIYFSNSNLLRADEDDVSRYEPVHDVVAKQISELRSLESKEFNAFLKSFQSDYTRWIEENKSETRFLTESDIAKASIYLARLEKIPDYENHWKEYLQESNKYYQEKLSKAQQEAIEKEQRNVELQEALQKAQAEKLKADRNVKWAIGIAGITVFFLLLAAYYGYKAKRLGEIADEKRIEADSAKSISDRALAASEILMDNNKKLLLQAKIEAANARKAQNGELIAKREALKELKNANTQKQNAENELTLRKAAQKERESIEVKKYISAAQRMHKIEKYDLEESILRKGLKKFKDNSELLDSLNSLNNNRFFQP